MNTADVRKHLDELLPCGADSALSNCVHYLREEMGQGAAADQIKAVRVVLGDLVEAASDLLAAASLSAATGKPFAYDSPGILAVRTALARIGAQP